MQTIYEKVEEMGLRIPREICRLSGLEDEVVINVYKGKIEIKSPFIPQREAEKIANKYLVLKVGDGLIANDLVLINGKWKVKVVYSHTQKYAGFLCIDAKTGAILYSKIE